MIWLALGCSQVPPSIPAEPAEAEETGAAPSEVPDPDYPELPELEATIASEIVSGRIPGLSAAIVDDGDVAWAKGFGWADEAAGQAVDTHTAFMLASVSKTISSVAVMQVVEQGLFDLDTDIDDILPFDVDNPDHPEAPITVRHLLTHTSTIKDNWDVLEPLYVDGDSPISLHDFLEGYLTPGGTYFTGKSFSSKKPATSATYSNVGATLAAYLVEAATGVPFDIWCNTEIFEPLGMTRTGWYLADLDGVQVARPYHWVQGEYQGIEHYGFPDYPDGQLRSTAEDLGKFLAAFSMDGTYHDARILSPESVAEMRRVQYPDLDDTQGLIWYYERFQGENTIGHNGGDWGVSTQMDLTVDEGLGVIVLMNGDNERADALEAIRGALFEAGANLGNDF